MLLPVFQGAAHVPLRQLQVFRNGGDVDSIHLILQQIKVHLYIIAVGFRHIFFQKFIGHKGGVYLKQILILHALDIPAEAHDSPGRGLRFPAFPVLLLLKRS